MKRNFNLLFFLKKGKTDPQGISSIYMRVTIEKKRAEIATGKVCQDIDWENGKIKGNSAKAKTLNIYLHQMELKVHNSHRQLLMRDEDITAEAVMNEFLGKSIKVRMLTEVFEMHNKEMKELVDIEFSPMTLLRYQTALRHINWDFAKSGSSPIMVVNPALIPVFF